MTRPGRSAWFLDPVLLLVILVGVVVGSLSGARGGTEDIDERLFRSTIVHMRAGESYYEASAMAISEKDGAGPSQVRSLRTPVVAELLRWFPPAAWRWLAAVPAIALCLAAAGLAGPQLLGRRVAAGIASMWMLVSLPLLYLHQELWGAALLILGGLQMRDRHDGRAAIFCLLATAVRELFGLSLLVGLLLGRDRRPWAGALATCVVGATLHARWAQSVLDPNGFDPPLQAMESYLKYVSPGTSGPARAVGALLLVMAGAGFWLRRRSREFQFLGLAVLPLVVATALAGRSYWSLTWCGVTSAAGAVAVVELTSKVRGGARHPSGEALGSPR